MDSDDGSSDRSDESSSSEGSLNEGDSDRFDDDSSSEDAPDEDAWFLDFQRIRENNPLQKELTWTGGARGGHNYVLNITGENWEEIGHAISSNTHLESVRLVYLNDGALVSLLFQGLTRSASIELMHLNENGLSAVGVRCMVPFLQNANKLRTLVMSDNNIQSEGFNALFLALRDSPVQSLNCKNCGIESIEIDIDAMPANLTWINLSSNSISAAGCRGLAKLLRGKYSLGGKDAVLKYLWLSRNKIDDEGVAILVDALQNNTSLDAIDLIQNDGISDQGEMMCLRLVNDISSIKTTLGSNHTLRSIYLKDTTSTTQAKSDADREFEAHIGHALAINRKYNDDPEAAGREKVIETQLHSKRANLADLQGVDHSVYSEINPLHLPEVLSLVGQHHGQGELYVALKSSIAGVISTVNRKEFIRQQRDYHAAKAEQLNAELAAIEAAEGDTVHVGNESHSNKRRRK